MSVTFFSYSQSEEPLTLVGRWQITLIRTYEDNKLIKTYINDDESKTYNFKEDGTVSFEVEG